MGYFLGDPWVFVDTSGGVEFGQDVRDARPSALIKILAGDPGGAACEELLETLADYDGVILEHLLEDRQPATAKVYKQFTATLREDLLVPLLLGVGALDRGLQRLLKTLRHDVPAARWLPPGEVSTDPLRSRPRFSKPYTRSIWANYPWRGCGADRSSTRTISAASVCPVCTAIWAASWINRRPARPARLSLSDAWRKPRPATWSAPPLSTGCHGRRP